MCHRCAGGDLGGRVECAFSVARVPPLHGRWMVRRFEGTCIAPPLIDFILWQVIRFWKVDILQSPLGDCELVGSIVGPTGAKKTMKDRE